MATHETHEAIRSHLADAGYADAAIAAGLAWADEQGWGDRDEALSLTLSHILYDAGQLADGVRVAVERGSW